MYVLGGTLSGQAFTLFVTDNSEENQQERDKQRRHEQRDCFGRPQERAKAEDCEAVVGLDLLEHLRVEENAATTL
jgi:hypothetical protein